MAGNVIFAGDVADAEQHRGGERAGDRAEAADRHDDQHIDQIGQRERRIEPDQFDGERAAEAGKPAAEREGDGEQCVDIDAEPARHALVVDGGAHLRAEAGVFDGEDQQKRDQQRDADKEQPVNGEVQAGEGDRAAQIGRQLHRLIDRAVDIGRRRDRDEDDADGQQALFEIARIDRSGGRTAVPARRSPRRRR